MSRARIWPKCVWFLFFAPALLQTLGLTVKERLVARIACVTLDVEFSSCEPRPVQSFAGSDCSASLVQCSGSVPSTNRGAANFCLYWYLALAPVFGAAPQTRFTDRRALER